MKANPRYIILTFSFLTAGMFCFAQNSRVDSFLNLIKTAKEDTCKVNHLNDLGWELMSSKPDTSVFLSKQALALASQISEQGDAKLRPAAQKMMANSLGQLGAYSFYNADYPKALVYWTQALKIDEELKNKMGILRRLGNIGGAYQKQANYPRALEYSLMALKIAEELDNKSYMSSWLYNIATIYLEQANYTKALEFNLRALKVDEELGNKELMADHLGNIGIIYSDQGDYTKALDYYFRSLKINEELKTRYGIASNYGNIGIVFKKQGNYSKALEYYFKALKLTEETGDKGGTSIHLGNIGSSYQTTGEFNKALEFFLKALKLAEETGDKKRMAIWLNNIGSTHVSLGKYREAFTFLHRAHGISDSIKMPDIESEHYRVLSYLYQHSGVPLPDRIDGPGENRKLLNTEEMRIRALHYFKKYKSLRDTLFSEENKKQLVRKEMNFEFEKKEAEVRFEQEKKDALAKEELKEKERERNYFIAGFVLVGILAVFIFRGYRQKQKANLIITEQKILVEEKQKEILDSIHYAKRIQTALITNEKYIDKTLNRLKKES